MPSLIIFLLNLSLPNLQSVGNFFLFNNTSLTSLSLPELEGVGDGFLYYNRDLKELSLPNLQSVGDYFMYNNRDLAKKIREEMEGRKKESDAMFSIGSSPETFKERQKRAVDERGVVMPGLNGASVKVTRDIPKHPYTGTIMDATKQAIEDARKKYNPNGEAKPLYYDNHGQQFSYTISSNAIDEYLNPKQQTKSVNRGVHLALTTYIDDVIGNSIEVEEHPDYEKNENDIRDGRKVNPNALMHRFYGVAEVDGKPYRVMTLMREEKNPLVGNGIRSYEAQKIEVLNEESPSTSNGVGSQTKSEIESSHPLANLLKDVEKSYDDGKKLLDESKKKDPSFSITRFGISHDREIYNGKSQEEISDIQYKKANEVLKALYDAGYKDFYISRSITDFGVSTYIQGMYNLKFRISDHSVTSTRRIMEEEFFELNTPTSYFLEIVDEASRLSKERWKKWEEQNERDRLLDEKWERIKPLFRGLGFKTNDRTYQNFEEFSSNKNRSNILQTPLDRGAFMYEWTEPTDSYTKEKPSYEWLEHFDEENSEVQTTLFSITNEQDAEVNSPEARIMASIVGNRKSAKDYFDEDGHLRILSKSVSHSQKRIERYSIF